MKPAFVYIMANRKNGTLYTGMTTDISRRVFEHKNDLVEGFSKKYQTHILVYAEMCDDVETAIRREKNIKEWKRAWKIRMIEKSNPTWRDLSFSIPS